MTLTGDARTADALVEEVCARAIQKHHMWKGDGRLESWIFSLIHSGWSEEPRRRGRQETQQKDSSGTAATTKGAASSKALLCLPAGLATALLLVDVEGFDYPEAASILGIAPEMLSSRLCAARLSLATLPPDIAEKRA
ncbi:sigma factor-like helix-turn-helix DNA-binding protein [Neorhizobium sp. NCHU2750]|uniref:sigma factor-like helix-turn-helix DNA-binding protein n=1 Tax=Neorhizobium sp. NCHU2750 TaxID=1825976 RepID=UPI0013C3ECC2